MLRAFDKWLLPYLLQEKYIRPPGKTRVFIVVCDHFEPFHATDRAGALQRMQLWQSTYPELQREIFDATGLKIAHSFFYPIEQYDQEVIDRLSDICHACECETEIHLHHKNDTGPKLRQALEEGRDRFAAHGLLSRSPQGELRYAFIHGNWALDDSDPHGKNCGVADELGILRETGCYADFTMPSAPHGTQTRTINTIYYAKDTPARKSHDFGWRAMVGKSGLRDTPNHLLMVQGPLALNWKTRKWGVVPKVENADLTGANPPTGERFHLWMKQGIHVRQRPDWVFIKLHTHGAIPENSGTLLGEPMRRFCQNLHAAMREDSSLEVCFLTARQAVNLVHAAEDGQAGPYRPFLDYLYRKN